MVARSSSKTVVYAALIGNLLVAVTKAVAAFVTGSSAMSSEAIHSFVDTWNEILLLYGMRRAAVPPDHQHPLGHGRELYFWSFIVAVLIFALGAGVAILEGIGHIRDPQPMTNPNVNYIVLALAFVFEGATWLIALKQFKAAKGELGFYDAFRRSKDPPSFMVLFEDSAALVGIVIAALGTFIATTFDAPVFDGVASILIGLVLAGTSVLLARESKSLLIGEQAPRELTDTVTRIINDSRSARANGMFTVQLAPNQTVVAVSMEFADELRATDIENLVIDIEAKVRAARPDVVALFVKPQTAKAFQRTPWSGLRDVAD